MSQLAIKRPKDRRSEYDQCPGCDGAKQKRSKSCAACRNDSRPDAMERIIAGVVETEHGCWLWQGSTDGDGYGYAWDGVRVVRAHRLAYESFVAPIPEGLELDHLCRIRGCVNPGHLEPVTHAENDRRRGAAVTHCSRGHEFTEQNTYVSPDGHRHCRLCTDRSRRKYIERRTASRSAGRQS